MPANVGAEMVHSVPLALAAVRAGYAPAGNNYAALASLASGRVASPVTLASSAPVVSTRGSGQLVTTVGLDPRTGQFVAASREGRRSHPLFAGASLVLACSAANERLTALAPLESLIRQRPEHPYRRTCPQYLQELHFHDALSTLAEFARKDEEGLDVSAIADVS